MILSQTIKRYSEGFLYVNPAALVLISEINVELTDGLMVDNIFCDVQRTTVLFLMKQLATF